MTTRSKIFGDLNLRQTFVTKGLSLRENKLRTTGNMGAGVVTIS